MSYLFHLKFKIVFGINILLSLTICSFAQENNPIVNSGDLLQKGMALHDKSQYKEAINLYKQINPSDTNYSKALYELAYSCEADSQFLAAHEYAMLGLKLFPEQSTTFGIIAGNTLDDLGKTEEALKTYEEALTKDPQSYILYYNKAVAQLHLKNEVEAKQSLQQSLLINPYYSSAHYLLAGIYLRAGNFIPAILAYQTCLMVAPDGKYAKTCVKNLTAISSVTDEMLTYANAKKTTGEDNFDLQQQILLSKIALDKQYQLRANLEDKIVRQIQVTNEKLVYKASDKGFAMQYYVPLYTKIFKSDQFEAMIYDIFSGLGIDDVKNWMKKNSKKIDQFQTDAVNYFNEIRTTRALQLADRPNITSRYYYEDGKLLGKGMYSVHDKTIDMTGDWELFYPANGALKAKGNFSSPNEKDGEWVYYYNTGVIKEKATYNKGKINGVVKGWYDNGNKKYEDDYVDHKVEGKSRAYYYNGILKKETDYKNDKKNGVEKGYSVKGYLTYIANFVDDEYQGAVTFYYQNGKKEDEVFYTKGKAEGQYKGYYKDGKLQAEGNYVNDKKDGLWTYWYNNGKVKGKTTYAAGEITGEFTEYNESGNLSRKGNYFKKKIDGKVEAFGEDGKLYNDITYDKGKLRSINFYDEKGQIISSTSTQKGAADISFYSQDGVKTGQGFFNKEGNKDGVFTNFYTSGKAKDKTTYKDGVQEGVQTTYYNNGQIKYENNYSNDKEDGYSKGFFFNGKLEYEGWVVDGDKQQQIFRYNQLGDLKSKEYYLNNDLNGYTLYYYPDGKKDYLQKYSEGWLEEITQYDAAGKEIKNYKLEKGNVNFIFKHLNGKNFIEGSYKNYMLDGKYNIYYFDGSTATVMNYKNGEKDGLYKSYFYGGQLYVEGEFVSGEKTGTWKYYYENGKVREEENFKDGELNGTDTYYFEDGTVETIANYKNDVVDGPYQYFAENNQLALIINYSSGTIKSYTYLDKNGVKVPPVILKGGTGIIKSYYKNGNPSAEINFEDNEINGIRNFFWASGKPFVINNRSYGYDTGLKKVFYSNGNLKKEENYLNGNLHGICKRYYPNGKLEMELNYYNNDLHGICKYYDENGKLKQTRTYYYDVLQNVQ